MSTQGPIKPKIQDTTSNSNIVGKVVEEVEVAQILEHCLQNSRYLGSHLTGCTGITSFKLLSDNSSLYRLGKQIKK